MKWLSIFKKDESKYQEELVKQLLLDKERLLKEVQELRNKLDSININKPRNNNTVKKKLSPTMVKLVKIQELNQCGSYKELSKVTGLKPNSLQVYASKIRERGHEFNLIK